MFICTHYYSWNKIQIQIQIPLQSTLLATLLMEIYRWHHSNLWSTRRRIWLVHERPEQIHSKSKVHPWSFKKLSKFPRCNYLQEGQQISNNSLQQTHWFPFVCEVQLLPFTIFYKKHSIQPEGAILITCWPNVGRRLSLLQYQPNNLIKQTTPTKLFLWPPFTLAYQE